MTSEEKDVLLEILYNREGALAQTFNEIRRLSKEVAPPQEIRTVPYKAWQEKGFRIPKALKPKVIKIVLDRKRKGVLEECYGPYRNPYFLVPKKNSDYRLMNAAIRMNRVTIRDANLPPSSDEFSERFIGMYVVSLINQFSRYNQVPLAEYYRDITAFQTPLRLMR